MINPIPNSTQERALDDYLHIIKDEPFVNLEMYKKLFNAGVLGIEDARWCEEKGYQVVCAGGQVVAVEAIG